MMPCEKVDEVVEGGIYIEVGNFCVDPRSHTTKVRGNLGIMQKIPSDPVACA